MFVGKLCFLLLIGVSTCFYLDYDYKPAKQAVLELLEEKHNPYYTSTDYYDEEFVDFIEDGLTKIVESLSSKSKIGKFIRTELKKAKKEFTRFFNKLILAISGKIQLDPLEITETYFVEHFSEFTDNIPDVKEFVDYCKNLISTRRRKRDSADQGDQLPSDAEHNQEDQEDDELTPDPTSDDSDKADIDKKSERKSLPKPEGNFGDNTDTSQEELPSPESERKPQEGTLNTSAVKSSSPDPDIEKPESDEKTEAGAAKIIEKDETETDAVSTVKEDAGVNNGPTLETSDEDQTTLKSDTGENPKKLQKNNEENTQTKIEEEHVSGNIDEISDDSHLKDSHDIKSELKSESSGKSNGRTEEKQMGNVNDKSIKNPKLSSLAEDSTSNFENKKEEEPEQKHPEEEGGGNSGNNGVNFEEEAKEKTGNEGDTSLEQSSTNTNKGEMLENKPIKPETEPEIQENEENLDESPKSKDVSVPDAADSSSEEKNSKPPQFKITEGDAEKTDKDVASQPEESIKKSTDNTKLKPETSEDISEERNQLTDVKQEDLESKDIEQPRESMQNDENVIKTKDPTEIEKSDEQIETVSDTKDLTSSNPAVSEDVDETLETENKPENPILKQPDNLDSNGEENDDVKNLQQEDIESKPVAPPESSQDPEDKEKVEDAKESIQSENIKDFSPIDKLDSEGKDVKSEGKSKEVDSKDLDALRNKGKGEAQPKDIDRQDLVSKPADVDETPKSKTKSKKDDIKKVDETVKENSKNVDETSKSISKGKKVDSKEVSSENSSTGKKQRIKSTLGGFIGLLSSLLADLARSSRQPNKLVQAQRKLIFLAKNLDRKLLKKS